jgi:hypothetical protein
MGIVFSAFSLFLGASGLATQTPPVPTETTARLDAILQVKWKDLGLCPKPPADDDTFLRRVWLDLAGHVPPVLKARGFLEDRDPSRRTRLVDSLLASDDFADHWGGVLAEQLTGKRPVRQDRYDGRVLHAYLRDSLLANKSYGRIVRELICGEGMSDASGPANFLLRYEARPPELAGAVAQQFLGISLRCAQCHHHPSAPWTQDDFWGTAAFFGRLKLLESASEDENFTAVLEARRGELQLEDPRGKRDAEGKLPKKAIPPRLLHARENAAPDGRRAILAAWVTAEDNPYFARNTVNQVWAHLIGTPLVSSLDLPDAPGNARHRDLLDLLAGDFTTHHYDFKRLVRNVVLCRAYQAAAPGPPAASARYSAAAMAELQVQYFTSFPVRPLSVDQLFASIAQATGYRGEEANEAAREDDDEDADAPVNLLGERALSNQRALALQNSRYVSRAVRAGSKLARAVHGGRPGAEHVTWLFLATLSRPPRAEEATAMLTLMREGRGLRGLEDVLWALLNSAEFNFNH